MIVADARQVGHEAGLVVVSADADGPLLAGLTWSGIWLVITQYGAGNLVTSLGQRGDRI
jgi:hypothetical protein